MTASAVCISEKMADLAVDFDADLSWDDMFLMCFSFARMNCSGPDVKEEEV